MKKLQTLLSLFCALVGLHTFAQSAPSNSLTMYVGTYTEGGNSKGIYTIALISNRELQYCSVVPPPLILLL